MPERNNQPPVPTTSANSPSEPHVPSRPSLSPQQAVGNNQSSASVSSTTPHQLNQPHVPPRPSVSPPPPPGGNSATAQPHIPPRPSTSPQPVIVNSQNIPDNPSSEGSGQQTGNQTNSTLQISGSVAQLASRLNSSGHIPVRPLQGTMPGMVQVLPMANTHQHGQPQVPPRPRSTSPRPDVPPRPISPRLDASGNTPALPERQVSPLPNPWQNHTPSGLHLNVHPSAPRESIVFSPIGPPPVGSSHDQTISRGQVSSHDTIDSRPPRPPVEGRGPGVQLGRVSPCGHNIHTPQTPVLPLQGPGENQGDVSIQVPRFFPGTVALGAPESGNIPSQEQTSPGEGASLVRPFQNTGEQGQGGHPRLTMPNGADTTPTNQIAGISPQASGVHQSATSPHSAGTSPLGLPSYQEAVRYPGPGSPGQSTVPYPGTGAPEHPVGQHPGVACSLQETQIGAISPLSQGPPGVQSPAIPHTVKKDLYVARSIGDLNIQAEDITREQNPLM